MKVLIEQVQNGDQDALLFLIKKMDPLLKKYSHKLNYEDAYQDVLVDFIELIIRLDISKTKCLDDGCLISYLQKSIHHSYAYKVRKLHRRCIEANFSDLSDAEQIYVQSLLSEPDKHNDIFFLDIQRYLTQYEFYVITNIYYYGYKVADIASVQNKSPQAIHQTKWKALTKLRECYK